MLFGLKGNLVKKFQLGGFVSRDEIKTRSIHDQLDLLPRQDHWAVLVKTLNRCYWKIRNSDILLRLCGLVEKQHHSPSALCISPSVLGVIVCSD